MDKVLGSKTTGHRTILGTEHPITTNLERVVWPGKRPTWRVTFGICNGTAAGALEYRTLREARAEFDRE